MLKPFRFNPLLKAVPGTAHLQNTPIAKTHEHITTSVEVDQIHVSTEDSKVTHSHAHITKDVEHQPETNDTAAQVHTKVKAEVDVSTQHVAKTGMPDDLKHVHTTTEGVSDMEMTPPHPPREETPTYIKTHNHLVNKLDEPCAICGVRKSTLNVPEENPFGAKDLETHHYPIERSLLNACDVDKVKVIFPQVKDRESLEAFIDSEDNMMVLCDVHHRHPLYGIHHLVGPDFSVQPFLFGGYQVVSSGSNIDDVRSKDEAIVKDHIKDEKELYGDQSTKTAQTNGSHKAAPQK